MPIIKKPFTLSPLNDNPCVLSGDGLSVSGGFSHKQGFPTIKFSMPPQPLMLEMGSLKLTGQIIVKQSNGNALVARNDGINYANGVKLMVKLAVLKMMPTLLCYSRLL